MVRLRASQYLSERDNGFTLIELMIAVAILGLLLAAAVFGFTKARVTSQTNACIENLLTISGAKEQWALENRYTDGVVPNDTDLFGTSLYISTKPACPANGTYSINGIGSDPTCSISGHVITNGTGVSTAPLRRHRRRGGG